MENKIQNQQGITIERKMKKLILIITLIFSISGFISCGSSAPHRLAKDRETKLYNEYKLDYRRGKELFFEGKYSVALNYFTHLIRRKTKFSDSVRTFLGQNLNSIIVTESNIEDVKILSKFLEELHIANYELEAKADSIILAFENERIHSEQRRDEKKEILNLQYEEMLYDYQLLAYDLMIYYADLISNKTYNQIADIMYDEGFRRRYFESTTVGVHYIKTYSYYNNDYDLSEHRITSDDDEITLYVDVWYSYGFGQLYTDIYAYISFTIHNENGIKKCKYKKIPE